MSGWHETMDESREGGKEGELRPEMKVTPLGMLHWEDIEQALGGQTSEGVVCKPPGEDRKFIFINSTDDRICDFKKDCEAGWDERLCLGPRFEGTESLLISGGDRQTNGVYSLVRDDEGEPSYYSRIDGGSYLSKRQDWQISAGDSLSDKVIRYKRKRGKSDTVPYDGWEKVNEGINEGEKDRRTTSNLVVSSSSGDTDQLVREELVEVGEGVVCAGKWGDLLQIDFGDPQLCNNEEDCVEGRDERFCQWTANLPQEELLRQEGALLEDKVVCLDYRERWWVTINKEDHRICDFKCDCHSCWDEA